MLEAAVIFAAGLWAGGINVIVGSGSLVTFPVLLLFGYPPVVANVSNNIGILGGGATGIYGYRKELRGNRAILTRLVPASLFGALLGALLLLVLPAAAFKAIVPVLIVAGLVMVVAGPAVQRKAAARAGTRAAGPVRASTSLIAGVFVLGVYGGYFGAAQGILLVGLMSMALSTGIQQVNAIKNVLATAANAMAAVTFMLVAWDQIDWPVVALIAGGAFIGGYAGARIGRRLPPAVLRAVIVLIGVVAVVKIVFFD